MNVKKFNKDNYKRIIRHCFRTKDVNGNYHERSNPDIDFSRTHLNYCIGGDVGDVKWFDKKLQDYMETNKVRNKTTVLLASWVIQIPDFYDGDEDEFFQKAFDIFAKKYPYYIGGFVHKDETTPHMHFLWCPIKDGKFNAKEILTKQELENMHLWFEKELEKSFGYHVAIMKDETRQREEFVEKYGKIKGIFDEGENPKYVPMKELKARTRQAILDEYLKQQDELENARTELNEYKEYVKQYHDENNLDEIIRQKSDYIPRQEVEQMIGQLFDMLELDLGKERVKKYRKFFEGFGYVIDKIKNIFYR